MKYIIKHRSYSNRQTFSIACILLSVIEPANQRFFNDGFVFNRKSPKAFFINLEFIRLLVFAKIVKTFSLFRPDPVLKLVYNIFNCQRSMGSNQSFQNVSPPKWEQFYKSLNVKTVVTWDNHKMWLKRSDKYSQLQLNWNAHTHNNNKQNQTAAILFIL